MSDNKHKNVTGTPSDNLAEEVLRQGGKSAEEIERMGKLDRGDEEFENTFEEKFRTTGSPIHRAVWQNKTPVHKFGTVGQPEVDPAQRAHYLAQMDKCVAFVKAHRDAGTVYGADNKVTDEVIDGLAKLGYWGALIETKYGGWGCSVVDFMSFLTRMAHVGDATVAGMASIHGCIGLVDPISAYGNDAQKAKYLPRLASGEALSAFALTEPNAGSDLTALRTTAVLDGDHYKVNGRKLFISNILPGRTIAIVCLIDGKPSVLISELPKTETAEFSLDRYQIHAVTHIHNYGIIFKDFLVPKENLLVPPVGDGLTIAYHGLNRGRIALCANAAGTMRQLLKSMMPWIDFRWTYGDKIGNRELVLRRAGRVASMILGADALVEWCSSMLDQGYRGELECIVAKIFGSESLKETAVDLALKTHGGRSFLKGHIVGDNIHDLLAPCIYEGEGEMLAMAFFKGLVKDHGNKFMGPIAKQLSNHKIKKFNPANPSHAWKLRKELTALTAWIVAAELNRSDKQRVAGMPANLQRHIDFATANFRRLKRTVNYAMLKHQMKLADRQLTMVALSMDVQRTVTMLAACMYAAKRGDEASILAADVLCQDLSRKIKPSVEPESYFRDVTRLGKLVGEGKFAQIDDTMEHAVLKPYVDNAQRTS